MPLTRSSAGAEVLLLPMTPEVTFFAPLNEPTVKVEPFRSSVLLPPRLIEVIRLTKRVEVSTWSVPSCTLIPFNGVLPKTSTLPWRSSVPAPNLVRFNA